MDENEKVDEERKKGKLGSETSEGDGKTWWQTGSLKREKKTKKSAKFGRRATNFDLFITKKRNNIIDILKAGGTRILLFLLSKNILLKAKNQAR